MKYVLNLIRNELAELLAKHGGFYAETVADMKAKAKAGVRYTASDCGLVLPFDNKRAYYEEYAKLVARGVHYDKAHNGEYDIIKRELRASDSFINCDMGECADMLNRHYGYTREAVREVWLREYDDELARAS